MSRFRLDERAAGVLLHPTSLPGPFGSGDLGPEAVRLAGWLHEAGARFWQMLPVSPPGFGNSPYSAQSAFAGNPLLVSPARLQDDGLLDSAPEEQTTDETERVDYPRAAARRERLLRRAFTRFPATAEQQRDFEGFCEAQGEWLEPFVLYRAIKSAHGEASWTAWPEELRSREPRALARSGADLAGELSFRRFEQWCFDRHWRAFREACHERGVGLIGDVPIFVAHDSADVWSHPEWWWLDDRGEPTVVAGVPPDYFSATGQRWGNPLYRWDRLRETGYRFWVERLELALERFDALRLDHFIGFHRAWEIPVAEQSAVSGRFVPGPGGELFERVREKLGELPFIAEDLGLTTPEVRALRDRFGFPGLRVLQFAFGTDPQADDFLPHRYRRRTIVYTGTHDNDTVVGWFHEKPGRDSTRTRAGVAREQRAALDYLGGTAEEIHWSMIRAALWSVADLAVVPAQDLLGLGSLARMNRPATTSGNWEWRLAPGAMSPELASRLAKMVRVSGRWPMERKG